VRTVDRENEALTKALHTLNKDEENPFSNMFIGLVYEELGDTYNALKYMEKSYDLMPNNHFIKINYCSTLSNHGHFDKATSLCPK
jgi:predicted Zn-dependent protease